MRILIDIGHPAHVHYFRNMVKIMENRGHQFFIIARDKEISHNLLEYYNLDYVSRGKGKRSLIGKIIYTLKADYIIFKLSRNWKPDIFLSFGSPYTAHVSKLLKIPHIALTDTEHAALGILAFVPFTETILTPDCFYKDFGRKHIRINGYFELSYLHKNYYKPKKNIRDKLNLRNNDKFVLFRFVSWGASHDIGQSGINDNIKHKLINIFLTKGYKVLISSEKELPDDLKRFQIKIPPERMHDALAYTELYIGEGATMASECAMLGTPAIYVNSITAGTLEDQEKYGLIYSFRNSEGVLEKAFELLKTPNLKRIHQERRKKMLADKIDVTAFMVWFVENYPESVEIMKKNPEYQNRFK